MNAPTNLAMWNRLEVSDRKYVKEFNKGKFKGHSVDPIYNVKRVTEELGPLGFAWGWEVKSERTDTYGEGKDQKAVHSCIVRAWFRQEDGSLRYVEHVGTTPVAYWTRSGYFEIDDEAAKKSVTDALSKIMVSLGASADIWLGRFDGNKYVAPDRDGEEKPPAPPRDAPRGRPEPAASLPPEDARGEVVYDLEGYAVRISEWVATARSAAGHRRGDDLLRWWAGYRDTRATIYRLHPAHRDSLLALSKDIVDRAEAEGAAPELVALARGRKPKPGNGTVPPDQAMRAG